MTSVHLNSRWGLQRTGQLCSEIFNDKLSKALHYAVRSSIYDAELTLRELTTSQSLLLSLFYGLLNQDISLCINLIEASSAAVQLRSSYIRVWLKDDFIFKQEDIAKVFSNLAELMDSGVSQLKLPQCIAVAFSGLVDKYNLLDIFNLSGDKKALELVKALNAYILELSNEVETKLENNREAVGSEGVTRDDELDVRKTQSDNVKEDIKGSTMNIINEQKGGVKRKIAETYNSETASPVTPPKVVNEASGYSNLESVHAVSQVEVGDEASGYSNLESVSQSEVGDKASGYSNVGSIHAVSQSEVGDEASGYSNVESLSQAEVRNEIYSNLGSIHAFSESEDRVYRHLEKAVRQNKPTAIRCLMRPGLSLDRKTESGDRLLHLAVHSGSEKALNILLELGAVPEMKNKDSLTPLQVAVRLNIPLIFQTLLGYVSDINQVIHRGNTILHEIALKGTTIDMNSVLRYKPNVDLQNNGGYTALHYAAKTGHIAMVRALINAGADVDILTKNGDSCLSIAVSNGNSSVIYLLLPRANIRHKNPSTKYTALHIAAYRGDCHSIELLLPRIHVNTRGYDSRTALHEAVEQGHIDAVHLLLARGAAVNACAKKNYTPLHYAVACNSISIISALLKKGAHINARNSYGETPLRIAKSKDKLINTFLKFRGAVL